MPITLYFDDGSHWTFSDGDAVPIVSASSNKPRPGFTKLQRDYPPEYVKTANIRVAALHAGNRVMKNGGYATVTHVVNHEQPEPPDRPAP